MTETKAWRVLLIDDSEFTLEIQTAILREAGFEVHACATVEEMDQTLQSWTPEVILSDVEMPGMTGVELCRLLKSRYETAHVPIVLCSALPKEELTELARDCEADGFLSKSDGLESLPEELRLLCESLAW